MGGEPGGAARRRWAWTALASLVPVVGGLVTVVALNSGLVLGLLAGTAVSVVVAAAAVWRAACAIAERSMAQASGGNPCSHDL